MNRRRKLFGPKNVKSLFSDVSPSGSSSSLSRTPVSNMNKTISNSTQASPRPLLTISNSTQASPRPRSTILNSDRASPRPPSTISNILSTLGKSSTDDEFGSDDCSTEGEQEENLSASCQVQQSMSNVDDDVQILLDKQENLDLDQLQTRYGKLEARYESTKKQLVTLQNKYKELEQNTIREFPIVI